MNSVAVCGCWSCIILWGGWPKSAFRLQEVENSSRCFNLERFRGSSNIEGLMVYITEGVWE